MNFKEEHIELFRSYLDGMLSIEAKVAFEQRISEDAEFNSLFEEFQSFETALRDTETLETYDRVGAFEKNFQKPIKKASIRRLWIATTSIAAVAAIVILVWMSGGTSNEDLVADYFEPYDNVVTVRGKKEVLDQALLAYDKEQYQEALKLLNKYPNDSIGMFYRAESLMALKRYGEAIGILDDVIAQEGIFVEVANYHKAIALLGLDETSKARMTLKKIPKSSFYFDKAKDLLERL